jgi:acyl-CoA-binding protein
LALQRHAALVEALERRSLAEALLEREYAIFKRASAQRLGRPRPGWGIPLLVGW